MANDFWDERYAGEAYHFGTEPAEFVKRIADRVPAGTRVLAVADGEGRSFDYLAGGGARVTAMDGSQVAARKARDLAAERGVALDFHVADIAEWE